MSYVRNVVLLGFALLHTIKTASVECANWDSVHCNTLARQFVCTEDPKHFLHPEAVPGKDYLPLYNITAAAES